MSAENKPILTSPSELDNVKFSRRTFLKMSGITGGLIAVAAATEPVKGAMNVLASLAPTESAEAQPLPLSFTGLPLVEGESIAVESEGLDSIYVTVSDSNYREKGGPEEKLLTAAENGLPKDSYLMQKPNTEIVENGGFPFMNTEVRYLPKNVKLADGTELSQGLLETPLEGFVWTEKLAKATEVQGTIPQELLDSLQTNTDLPDAAYSISAAQAGTLLDGLGGGSLEVETKNKMLAAWGDDETADPELFVNKWKNAVYVAASMVAADSENNSGVATVSSLTPSEGLLNLYSVIDGDRVRVVTRLNDGNETIFLVADGRATSEEQLNFTFENVAPANWEMLNAMLGNKKAIEVAGQTTEVRGDESVELAWQAESLSQAKVLLAGLKSGPQFASKVPTNENQIVEYQRLDTVDGKVQYNARVIDSQQPEAVRKLRYAASQSGEGQWVPNIESIDELPEIARNILNTRINLYAEVTGLEVSEVLEGAKIQLIESKVGGDPILLVTSVNNTPLVVGKLHEGEFQYKIAQLKDVAEQADIRMGVELHPNDVNAIKVKKGEFTSATMTYWWKNREKSEGSFSNSYDVKQANEADQIGTSIMRLGHVLSRYGHPEWLLQKSSSEIFAEIQDHIRQTVRDYSAMGVSEFNVVNEPFNSDEIANIIGRDNYVLAAFQAAFEARNELYAELEAEGKEKPPIFLGLSHAGNHISGDPGQVQSMELLNLLQANGLSPDYLDLHFHRKEPEGRPTIAEFKGVVDGYRSYKASDGSPMRIVIGEYDVYLGNNGGAVAYGERQGEIYYDDIKAMLDAGINDITFWGAHDDESWYETGEAEDAYTSDDADALLFDSNEKPKHAYFDTGRAIVDHIISS